MSAEISTPKNFESSFTFLVPESLDSFQSPGNNYKRIRDSFDEVYGDKDSPLCSYFSASKFIASESSGLDKNAIDNRTTYLPETIEKKDYIISTGSISECRNTNEVITVPESRTNCFTEKGTDYHANHDHDILGIYQTDQDPRRFTKSKSSFISETSTTWQVNRDYKSITDYESARNSESSCNLETVIDYKITLDRKTRSRSFKSSRQDPESTIKSGKQAEKDKKLLLGVRKKGIYGICVVCGSSATC